MNKKNLVSLAERSFSPEKLLFVRKIYRSAGALSLSKQRSLFWGGIFSIFNKEYKTEGMAFDFPRQQFPTSYRSRFLFDLYEGPERLLVKKWLDPKMHVLELGGCIGVLSCIINKQLSDRNSHVVVEANSFLIKYLSENKIKNSCGYNIENAIVSADDSAHFWIDSLMTANRMDSGRGSQIEVPGVSIELLEKKYNLSFTALIMDIEGGEYDVIVQNQYKLNTVNVVIVEMHRNILNRDKVRECELILGRAGLRKVESVLETEVWLR